MAAWGKPESFPHDAGDVWSIVWWCHSDTHFGSRMRGDLGVGAREPRFFWVRAVASAGLAGAEPRGLRYHQGPTHHNPSAPLLSTKKVCCSIL